jgi:hypothetical protein
MQVLSIWAVALRVVTPGHTSKIKVSSNYEEKESRYWNWKQKNLEVTFLPPDVTFTNRIRKRWNDNHFNFLS